MRLHLRHNRIERRRIGDSEFAKHFAIERDPRGGHGVLKTGHLAAEIPCPR